MKESIKRIVTVIMCCTISASAINMVSAKDVRLNNMWSHPQEKNFWCGYSAMQSVVQREAGIGNLKGRSTSMSQSEVAKYVSDGSNYNNQYSANPEYKDLPFYTGCSNTYDSNQNNYPVGRALKSMVSNGFSWLAYGCGVTGQSVTSYELKWRIRRTINNGHGVMACGYSKSSTPSHMPGYPSGDYGHWVAIDGYKNDGDTIWIIDPAGGSSVMDSGWKNVQRYYTVSIDKLCSFVEDGGRGIIW